MTQVIEQNVMTINQSVSIIRGFHAVTPVPRLAIERGLNCRLAVVMNTNDSDHDYLYFQDELFMEILLEVKNQLGSDTIRIEENADKEYWSIESLREKFRQTPEEDRYPPCRVKFWKQGLLVCLEETEFWAFIGGEMPYSDSYTLSFYTHDDVSNLLEAACTAACERMGVVILERLQASTQPVAGPWFKKLFGR